MERGEIRCYLGHHEVADGWVTGHVDMEEVDSFYYVIDYDWHLHCYYYYV